MNKNGLSVGFKDVIITPEEPMPMGGFGNTSHRKHTRVLEDLHGLCTAITDGEGETVIFITTDTTRAYPSVVPDVRQMISEKTGIPVSHIMFTATHTHSGPDLLNFEEEAVLRYLPKLKQMLLDGVLEALEDRKPATVSVGHVKTEGLNFVKHYKHVTEQGETKYFGDNFGKQVLDETTTHATDADTTMHLIRFEREGDKDVVLVNWRAHPQLTGSFRKYDMSADFPAPFRNILGAQLNCHVHFLQGAAGNINPKSRLLHENYSTDHNVFGARLAYYALKCLEGDMQPVPAGKIRTQQRIFVGQVNHTMDHLAEVGRQIVKQWNETLDREQLKENLEKYGFESRSQCACIATKETLPQTLEIELNAISVGEHVAFVTAPNELFDTNSMYTEANSPFAMTFTCGYANGHWFYIPSRFGFEYNCYESHVSRFVPGTGEQVSETFLDMLKALKNG